PRGLFLIKSPEKLLTGMLFLSQNGKKTLTLTTKLECTISLHYQLLLLGTNFSRKSVDAQ
ncbi:hypothetical protein, partial [Geobacillus stearothermophilus]|uniref:hypothetical protein n=1 Tax=Geobacillus stearothermophilus TaxID=1422 RepID=UPI001F209A87